MIVPRLLNSGDIVADRYEVLHLMYRGSINNVYKVRHLLSGEPMVLKCLASKFASDEPMQRRLRREGEVLAHLRSPHIVRAADFGTTADGAPFLVLEYLEGSDLGALLAEGRLGVRRSVELVAQACEGMAAVHAAGVVHRDIKPSNLFVCRTLEGFDWVKVLDLGIAKVSEGTLLTIRNSVIGTLNYMPPEQLRDADSLDARADVYALASVLYHCLAGEPPFVANSPHRLMHEILYGRCTPLWQRSPNVPIELANLVHRCLSRERLERPGSVVELQRLLHPFRPLRTVPPISGEAIASSLHGRYGPDGRPQLDPSAATSHPVPDTLPIGTLRDGPGQWPPAPSATNLRPAPTASQVLAHPVTWIMISLAVAFGFALALALEWLFWGGFMRGEFRTTYSREPMMPGDLALQPETCLRGRPPISTSGFVSRQWD